MNVRLSAALTVLLTAGLLAGCGNSSSSSGTTSTAADPAAADKPADTSKKVDGCTLVTAADLSKAAGASYSKIESTNGGTLCNVDAAKQTDAFGFTVTKEDGAMTTWPIQVNTIKSDDGSVTMVSGIGDRAAQGGVKEFAAEAKGYIVVIINADVNNPPTAKSFARSRAIAQLLTSKIQ